jgi:hypothetical protein
MVQNLNNPRYSKNMSRKYVVRCTKRISCDDAGLANGGYYNKGDYVTEDGRPTRSLDRAYVYDDDSNGSFPFEDVIVNLSNHFETVFVKIVEAK